MTRKSISVLSQWQIQPSQGFSKNVESTIKPRSLIQWPALSTPGLHCSKPGHRMCVCERNLSHEGYQHFCHLSYPTDWSWVFEKTKTSDSFHPKFLVADPTLWASICGLAQARLPSQSLWLFSPKRQGIPRDTPLSLSLQNLPWWLRTGQDKRSCLALPFPHFQGTSVSLHQHKPYNLQLTADKVQGDINLSARDSLGLARVFQNFLKQLKSF